MMDWQSFKAASIATPVYEQLADWLEDAIKNGQLAQGERLPSERDWAPFVGHSYDTARKATALLKSRGLLESRQGRGTFVKGA